mmetsp:Transcript_3625/g.6333  ORF Transcript_3625/g.6333 Transcript_3625/m.6333 type:complete len:103 (+) Transcript_3625:46-354(+)|eukprot:CAMPEP_0202024868 /NCGR_PEP_ID=MMETSP0905-20130828/55113_1 /ASSEMBLY_ACC=CAM_ASM_000554 /TAXON_ID=420261 /ORGANISM="Thalassiosira antarctica, Strain CCMP982" /LENGTH=102 /DNA_ID=CAMNT_0048587615 /DNA_START=24 /DNA_END=332 /DNA_ORIENTATION=-
MAGVILWGVVGLDEEGGRGVSARCLWSQCGGIHQMLHEAELVSRWPVTPNVEMLIPLSFHLAYRTAEPRPPPTSVMPDGAYLTNILLKSDAAVGSGQCHMSL